MRKTKTNAAVQVSTTVVCLQKYNTDVGAEGNSNVTAPSGNIHFFSDTERDSVLWTNPSSLVYRVRNVST